MKRNPEKILNSLTQHSSDLAYKFERLYRLLFNEEMYYIAYQRIYTKQGNMTKGVDGKTIDGFCWKIQCKLPPKTKRFCPLVLK